MTFEEQLTRAFETLTERLRGAIDLQVQRTSAELAAAAPAGRDREASGVQPMTEEMEIVVTAARQQARQEGLAAGREAGRREALEERAPQTVDIASRERLADAVRSLERARSLTEILDTLVSGVRTEAARADIWLIRGGRLHQWRAAGSDGAGADHLPARSLHEGGAMAEAVRTVAVASADGTLAVPIAIAGQVVAVLQTELGSEKLEGGSQNVEILTRYAARCLEALTAFKAARALTERPAEPDAADSSPPAIDEASAEEDTSARRYARLLVSEIKLYHESAVVDGCRDRDLATRLGGEIAHARVMYEQRVPPHVRQRADVFHDELVRTLANGDASLLEVKN